MTDSPDTTAAPTAVEIPNDMAVRIELRSRGYSNTLIDEILSREANGTKRAAAVRELTLACEDYDNAGVTFFTSNATALVKKIADAVALVTRAEIDSKITAFVQAHQRVRELRAQSGTLDEKLATRSGDVAKAGVNADIHNFVNRVLTEVIAHEGERVCLVIQAAERSV